MKQPFDMEAEPAAPPRPRGRPGLRGLAPFVAGALVGAVCVAPLALGLDRGRSALFAPTVPVPVVGRLPQREARAGLTAPYMAAVGAAPKVKVGDTFPDVSLDQGFPPEKFSLLDKMKGKRVILVGLPGAFTPTWSTQQVPGYLGKQAELKAKGVTDVFTYCVNDGAVMKAWAADQNIEGSMVTFLGDPRSELTEALGLGLDHPGPMSVLGNSRCKRFSMFIDDGVIKTINVAEAEDDPAGDANPASTFVEKMLEDIPDPA